MSGLVSATNNPGGGGGGGRDPNDPCKSNDGIYMLTPYMFEDGITKDETTGEGMTRMMDQDGDDDFLFSPCFEEGDSVSPTDFPSDRPTTSRPTTQRPSPRPTTTSPSKEPTGRPTMSRPTRRPTTRLPTPPPSANPTATPSSEPTTSSPSKSPTSSPSTEPPYTKPPVTAAPITPSPTGEPSTRSPTDSPSGEPIMTTISTRATTRATTAMSVSATVQDDDTSTTRTTTTTTTKAPGTTEATTMESIMLTPDTSQTETTKPDSATTFTSEEDSTSFYSCSNKSNGGSSSSSDIPPSDATELTITYDYELHTSSELDGNLLSSFENSVTRDLAGRYGLINCGSEPKRRSLRNLKQVEVVALDSAPVDERVVDDYECVVSVNLDSFTNCTPMIGYMTAYHPNSSNADETQAQLLALIENGMQNDLYTNDDVIKASYVGQREDDASQEEQSSQDGNVGDGNRGGNANAATGGPNLDGAKGTETTDGSDTGGLPGGLPLLAIGIAVILLALTLAVLLVVYLRKMRRSRLYTDGPNDMGNNDPNSLAAQDAEMPSDPDDVQLLPALDKLDMRSVHSESDVSTDVETENHTYENYEREFTEKYGSLYGSQPYGGGSAVSSTTQDYGDYLTEDNNGAVARGGNIQMSRASSSGSGGGSALAAMGMASTLAARSFTPINNLPADDAAAADDSPASPLEETPGAYTTAFSTNSNYVDTVIERTPVSDASDDSSVEEVLENWDQKPTTDSPSMDSSMGGSSGAFWSDDPLTNWA